jgi:hypothetical protein
MNQHRLCLLILIAKAQRYAQSVKCSQTLWLLVGHDYVHELTRVKSKRPDAAPAKPRMI